MAEEKKNGAGLLRWPWNIVIYILLVLTLWIFAIPVIWALQKAQKQNDPHGAAEGYCLSRTRKRVAWIFWSVLVLLLGVCAAAGFFIGIQQDQAYWDAEDYGTLIVCAVAAVLLLAGGIYMMVTAVRDVFFPGKSRLAQSIRSQLPYPEEAPPVEELFAMVDQDLEQNGRWFDAVGIGNEWVLGEVATKIERIRGIFTVDEIHQHSTQNGTRTSRTLELVLVDDRWQKAVTDFKKPDDLQAAADYLALRVPEAKRGRNGQQHDFMAMKEHEREEFERDFQQKQSLRASEQIQKETLTGGVQDMILQVGEEVTSRVSAADIEEQLRLCMANGGGFTLTPTRPTETEAGSFKAMRATKAGADVVELLLEPAAGTQGQAKICNVREAREILTGWLRRQVPALTGWQPRQVYTPAPKAAPQEERAPMQRLLLISTSGAAERHMNFTQEDIRLAANGIVDGSYQQVEHVLPSGYMWIQVKAGDKQDARCTVEATRPEGSELKFYSAKMTARQAAEWFIKYPYGEYLPHGADWKDITKQANKK